jgi:hypothetical protein
MHYGFLRFYTHLKLTYFNGGYPLKKFPSDHDDMVTRDADAGRVLTIKKFLSQNRIENLVDIILGRFPIK